MFSRLFAVPKSTVGRPRNPPTNLSLPMPVLPRFRRRDALALVLTVFPHCALEPRDFSAFRSDLTPGLVCGEPAS